MIFFLHGYEHKETATLMNISYDNARQLVSRAIREIKQYIKKIDGGN